MSCVAQVAGVHRKLSARMTRFITGITQIRLVSERRAARSILPLDTSDTLDTRSGNFSRMAL